MASTSALLIRPFALIGAAIAAVLLVASTAVATPPTRPTIASVRQQLDALAAKNSQIVDKFDGIQIKVSQAGARAASAQRASTQAEQRYSRAHQQFVEIIQAQYEGSGLGAAGALLDSNSSGNYLDRLDTLNLISNQTAEVVAEATQTRKAAAKAAATAASMLAAAKAERATLASARTEVEKQIARYKSLLATLTAEQQAAYERAQQAKAAQVRAATAALTHKQAGTTTATKTGKSSSKKSSSKHSDTSNYVITGAPSAKALIAVKFALAQVGKPYVYAAAGPGSYDCSGLTMASWRAAGVSLPHQASAQYNYGHHVSKSQLLPGDLVFFYRPIGHVAIYIGNGLEVTAPQTGEDVKVAKLAYMSGYTGATRIG